MTMPTLQSMRFGSLFAGIGGFDLGLERAGMTCSWQVEIDPACHRILSRHWPNVERFNDVRDVGAAQLSAVDLVCGGFPCQDLSVAGKRAGLAAPRSGLFFEFARLLDELSPPWVIIENVPGLLSSGGGRDMGTVLGTLAELGYRYAYRVLDAQYFGVAQRRRRALIIGGPRKGPGAPEVLLEPEGERGNSPASAESGPRSARTLETGTRPSSVVGRETSASRVTISTLQGGGRGRGQRLDAEGAAGGHLIAHTLTSHGRRLDGDGETFVSVTGSIAHALQAEGADASEDGTGRGTPIVAFHATQDPISGRVAAALGTNMSVGVAFAENSRAEVRWEGGDGQTVGALKTGGGKPGQSYPAALVGTAVRRLMPRECERLQGFPDDWTDGQSDAQRYRQLGNAMCVPVAEWVGARILAAVWRARRAA